MERREEATITAFSEMNYAIQEAGGTVLKWDDIKDIRVEELLQILGLNHITFAYDPSKLGKK